MWHQSWQTFPPRYITKSENICNVHIKKNIFKTRRPSTATILRGSVFNDFVHRLLSSLPSRSGQSARSQNLKIGLEFLSTFQSNALFKNRNEG